MNPTPELTRIAVVGAGTMGHGIAQVAAHSGFKVALVDQDEAALVRAKAKIEENLAGGISRGKLTEADRDRVRANLSTTRDLAGAAREAGLVIEAIFENLAAKRAVLEAAESAAPPDAILASNTSSLPIGQIAAALQRPERLIGMHFFNPVHLMKLIEVVVHPKTGDAARRTALEVARRMGKEPIVVQDSPGFATSRLGVVLGLEAMRMVEQGVASAADIDQAMVLGYNHPMGPLRLTDVVGLDVRLAIADTLQKELGGEQYRAPQLLRDMVKRGELGKKSGRGFYDWKQG
ncbi:MAG TPA: 3-hydroxyacyl-CoA dehydrogenase family protein [Planctomycetota bacterium]|jgi:3-hydroxybutyryl-CoA dehydrogenase|nr:3-hydroxyacyl-CoA dehydrogenase family protein [Planctomycetota bacterium]